MGKGGPISTSTLSVVAGSGQLVTSSSPIINGLILNSNEADIWIDMKKLIAELAEDEDSPDKYREPAREIIAKLVLGKL